MSSIETRSMGRFGFFDIPPKITIPLCVLLTVIFWASAFPAIQVGLSDYSPTQLALLRFAFTSLGLGFLAAFRKLRPPDPADWPAILLAGACGVTGYHTALNLGQTRVSAGAASFVVNTVPIFTTLLASVWLGEKFRIRSLAGLMLSFSGVLLIAVGEGKGFGLNAGVAFVLLAALFQTIYFILQKPLLKKYSVLEVAAYTVWAGTIWLLVLLPSLVDRISAASTRATLAGVFLGIFPGVLGFLTWSKLLSLLPASRASSFLYLVPVTAMFISWVWLGETPKPFTVAGGCIALSGVVLVNAKKSA